MVPYILDICGVTAMAIGIWRSYAVAREALAPLIHAGDPTRTAFEASRPLPLRPRVQLFARRLAVSLAWLAVAFYGLFLIVRAQALLG